jgi:ribosome-associated protein
MITNAPPQPSRRFAGTAIHPVSSSHSPNRRRSRGSAAVDDERPPSKTRLKAQMHDLQHLGEALVALDAAHFARIASDCALSERLVEAIGEARGITAWGGRRRQLQYIGKLMRDVDPEPIRRRLDAWAQNRGEDAARMHALERWRDRLLAEPEALDDLAAAHPGLDRPYFRALVSKARDERAHGGPPHAYRELYRQLKALDRG